MDSLPPEILEKIFFETQMSCMELFDHRRVCHKWNSVLSDPLFVNKYVLRQRYSVYPAVDGSVYERQLEEAEEPIRRSDDNEGVCEVGRTYFFEDEVRYFPWGNNPRGPYNISYVYFTVACWIFNEKCADFHFSIFVEKARRLYLCLHADEDRWLLKVDDQEFKLENNPFMEFEDDPWIHFAITYHDQLPYDGPDISVYINGCKQRLLDSCSYYGHHDKKEYEYEIHQCLVDLRLFPFRLSSLEIEAIYQQRCTFNLVEIGKALMEKKNSIKEEE